jgi:hypothetical protein
VRRGTFDFIASWIGVLLAVVLAVAGGLLVYAYDFVNTQVHDELAAQQITFPAADSDALKALPAADAAEMSKFAGQQMTTGAQAHTYANHFIAVHLDKIGGGQTYSQVSTAALADPTNTKLAATADTLFKGETLRSMLLNAYAFWQMGQVALIAGIVAIAAGVILLVLALLGFRHQRRTPTEQDLLSDAAAVSEPANA